jgi:3-oxoacyl-[acyl-carrier protein] reductase
LDLGINGRVAIVTGSSQGIGKAIAMGLAMEGARVVICARREDALKNVAEEIASRSSSEVLPIKADLSKSEDIKLLVQTTIQKFAKIWQG